MRAGLIGDEVLETIAVVGARGEIAGKLRARLDGIADGVSLTHNRAPDPDHWADVVADLGAESQAAPDVNTAFLRYGDDAMRTIDVALPVTSATAAPLLAFIHGGYWQWNAKEEFTFLAEPWLNTGADVAVLGYPLAPERRVSEITESVRTGVQFIADKSNGDIVLLGWSVGAQLAAKAGATQLVELGESVQHMVGNQPLECECEKVKCNCVKRCDCKLPSGPSLLQLQESLLPAAGADASADGAGAPAMLELGTGIVNQELSCDCDQVKCNCIKHCECSAAPSGM